MKKVKNFIISIKKTLDDLMWAKVWENTREGLPWLNMPLSISPGRWAVGYNYIYVLTRILEEMRPQKVLDFGLGISSSIFSAFFSYYEEAVEKHIIVEQDKEWIDFYQNRHPLSKKSIIFQRDVVLKRISGREYYAYNDIGEIVSGEKFDVISIDAPWGSNRNSRRDIVEYLPGILNERFVIIIDDTNRIGEKDTIREIEDILKKSGIGFKKATYSGISNCTVIVSEKDAFICSL